MTELRADPQNPNRMDPEDKARMAKALAEFGDLGGIDAMIDAMPHVFDFLRAKPLKGYMR